MLPVQVQVGVRDTVGVRHVVVLRRARHAVRPGTVGLRPADGRVDRHVGHVNALWHQFPRHALGETGLRLARHGEGPAPRIALERGAGVGEKDRAAMAVRGGRFEGEHARRGLLRDQEGAVGGVRQHFAHEGGVRFRDALAEDVAHPAVDVVHHQPRRAEILGHGLEEPCDGGAVRRVAGVVADAEPVREIPQRALLRVARGNGDLHAVPAEQARAARTDAGAAAHDQGDLGRVAVRHLFLLFVLCARRSVTGPSWPGTGTGRYAGRFRRCRP